MTEGRQSQRLPSRAPFGLHSGSIRVSRAVVPTQTLTKNSKRLEETRRDSKRPTGKRETIPQEDVSHSHITSLTPHSHAKETKLNKVGRNVKKKGLDHGE